MIAPPLPFRGPKLFRSPKPACLLLAAVSVAAVALVLYLNAVDNSTLCHGNPVDVPWSRTVLTYGSLATALAALAVAGHHWWRGRDLPVRPRGSLALLIVTGLLVGAAGIALVSTRNVIDFAEQMRYPDSLVVCT